ncbi:MAG: toprim domain-containing protein, partial [Candidatus Kariarchaeaceae archaeon]
VEKARLNRALENAEIRNIITAVGTGILDECDLEKCRYGRIVLLMDADVDGAHIATLLLTFFYRYLRPVIEDGRLYVARPPLFKITLKGDAANLIQEKDKKGKKKNYIYRTNDDEFDDLMYALNAMDIERKLITINRFKGLGEMNADQLKETTLDPDWRRVDRVNIDDAIEAEEWLTKLMGSEVEDRKNFIQNDVFVETDPKSRGKFYEIAFTVDESMDDEPMSDQEKELVEKEIESVFDEYEPVDRELIAALEEFQFS